MYRRLVRGGATRPLPARRAPRRTTRSCNCPYCDIRSIESATHRVFALLQQTVLQGEESHAGAGVDVGLVVDVPDVVIHSCGRDRQLLGDEFLGAALADEAEHF